MANKSRKDLVQAVPSATSGANQRNARAWNDRLILSLLRRQPGLSKADLARLTGLSAQALGQIIRRLEGDNLVVSGEPVRGKIGQPSVPWSLNPDGCFAFGLNIGRRSLELVLVDFSGQVRASARKACNPVSPKDVMDLVSANLTALANQIPLDSANILGLGASLPGIIREAPDNHAPEWVDIDLGELLREMTDLPVFIADDGDAAAAAEFLLADKSHDRDFLYLFIGWHAGGGLIMQGNIVSGRGQAAALGAIPVQGPDSPQALTAQASIANLDSRLTVAGVDPGTVRNSDTGWNIPDPHLSAWMHDAAKAIAQGFAAASAMVETELAVIDGVLPPNITRDMVALIKQYQSAMSWPGLNHPEIRAGQIGRQARAIGAAILPLLAQYGLEQKGVQNVSETAR